MADEKAKRILDQALNDLEREAPDSMTRAIRWIRDPEARWARLPLGILCIVASFFWFLPVIGIELLPIGMLLVAQDVPALRRPAARLVIWFEDLWCRIRGSYRGICSRAARNNRRL